MKGNAAMSDGNDEGVDLSGGMYDAGDHIKFGLPMDFIATLLSWSVLECGDQMDVAHQLGVAQSSIRWITDYLINAHPSSNVLYIQVCHAILYLLSFYFYPSFFSMCQFLYLKS